MSESLIRLSASPEEAMPNQAGAKNATLTDPGPPAVGPLRPRACRMHIRRQLAAAWPSIVTNVLIQAKKGSVSHTNLAAKLAGFDFRAEPQQKRKPREKSFAKQLLEEIDELEKKNIAEFGPL